MSTTVESVAPRRDLALPRNAQAWDLWCGLLPLIAMSPMLLFEAAALWSREYMRFFPVTLLLLAVLVAMNWSAARGTTDLLRRWIAISLFLLTTVVYLVAAWQFSPWLSHFALVGLFAAWALGRFGQMHWASVLAWTAILATTLPLPWNWDLGLLHWLQNLAAWGTAKALDALAIPCLQNGGLIETRSLALVADEVCGGLASLYAFISLAAILLAAQHRSLIVAAKVLFLVPFWTLFANFLRLFTILIVQEYWQRDMSSGWDFRMLELATSLLALLLIWLSSRFFASLYEPVPVADAEFGPVFSGINKLFCWPQADPFEEIEPEDEDERKHFLKLKRNREARMHKWPEFDWRSSPPSVWLVRLSAVLLLLSLVWPLRALATQGISNLNFGVPTVPESRAMQLASEDSLPATLGSRWNRVNHQITRRSPRSRLGAYSIEWEYADGARRMSAAIDLPFLGWHDPVAERELRGWKEDRMQLHWNDHWPWVEAELENELGGKAYVMYALFTPEAQAYTRVPSYIERGDASVELSSNDPALVADAEASRERQSDMSVTYQFQIFLESGVELSRSELSELRGHFLTLREQARNLPSRDHTLGPPASDAGDTVEESPDSLGNVPEDDDPI